MFRRDFISARSLLCVLALYCIVVRPADQFAQTPAPERATQDCPASEYQTGAILWTQSSAEYRALAYQAFSLARLRLDQYLREHRSPRRTPRTGGTSWLPAAVVVDVDETVLDNSRYQAELILRGLSYDAKTWQAWCERGVAGAVPGAVDFLNYASRRGVRVFYITNRKGPEKAGTIKNLNELGFPGVTEATVMIREEGTTSSKESRRDSVERRYHIALLVGDNLNDFNDDFAGQTIADRSTQVDRERAKFGSRFIVIPNPMYGDWEDAINHYQRVPPPQQRANRRAALKGL